MQLNFPSVLDMLAARMPFVADYRKHMQIAPDISASRHVQLMEMTHERLVYSFTAMPFVSLAATLFHGSKADPTLLGLWALGYCIAYFVSQTRQRAYQADKTSLSHQQLLDRWIPTLKRVAGLHGLALCLPLVLTVGSASFEFITFWYLTMGAIIAGNSTHQTPVLGVFTRFFNLSWNVATLLVVVAYPNDWPYIGLAVLMYTFGIYRHALIAHKFFLQQVRLEESSARLATQFKQAKEQAENSLLEKNQFLATASHDLRQPVHAMAMLLEAVKLQNKDANLHPALRDLGQSLQSMSAMFNSLLDLSKLEAGVSQVRQESVDLRAELELICLQFEHEAAQRHLSLKLHFPRKRVIALCDVNLLRQIMLNLVQNALRYTLQGGILIGLRSSGEHWQVEVWDTGVGVAQRSHKDIYLPYFREEQAWGVDSEGHGLGLSVVARCAKLMQAEMGMNSRLGLGSRFWLRLPKMAANTSLVGSLVAGVDSSSQPLAPLNTGRCLIVEDDPQVTQAWRVLMQAWGVNTEFASNSAQAIAILQTGFAPQVVLCDERLRAGESGFDLLKAILGREPSARGAMISGEFSSNALAQAESEGYLVFRKPVEMALIHALLSRWLLDDAVLR
jgi:signal transduction histidine kinase/CheY-like chemotaxis protein